MIRRSTLIAVEILLGLIAALAIGVGVAWWRLSQGPIELNAIREHVQTELSAARSGRPVGIDRIELAWSRQGNALELRAIGVTVEDGRGGVLSRSDEARIELGVLPLLIGRISLVRAEFSGGAITFTRKVNAAVDIAFGPEGSPADIIIPPPPPNETLEQRVARLLDGMEAAFRPIGPGGGLRALSVRNAALTIVDDAGGGRWTADDATFELARQGRALALVAHARLEAAAGAAPAGLRITTDTRFQSAVIEFSAENARPRALFSQAAMGPFAGLDAPISATISVGLDRQAGVNQFEGDVTIGRGAADMVGGRFDLDGGRLHGRYDIASDELIIDEITLAGDRTRIGGEVRVRDVSAIMRAAPDEPAAFDISLPSMRLDVPGTFAQPLSFSNVHLAGAIVSAERSIRFEELRAQTGDAALNASGRLYWAEAGADQRVHPGLELDGAVTGAIDARSVIAMWPIGLGEGARSYVARSLEAGRVTDGQVHLDIQPRDVAAGVFRDDAMDVRFNVDGGVFRFASTMSPVTDARGSGVLRGNRLDMTFPHAQLNGLTLTNARLELPRLKPKGAMATIAARVEGDARRFLEVLAQEPLSMGGRLPVDIASATGHGAVNVRIQRPMIEEVPREDWRFSIDGAFRDFAGNVSGRRLAVSQGQLLVRGDQRAVTVSGPIRAGTSAIENVRWVEHIGRRAGASSSEYEISGDFDANDLERLGYPIARYAQGRIGVTVSGQGRGFDVDDARIDLNLTNAAIEAPRAFWTKRAGQAASARFNVERQRDGGLAFSNIEARGVGMNVQGRVRLARDNRIVEADLPRVLLEGSSDARVFASRANDGALEVTVRGALFDAAPFMGSDAQPAGQNAREQAAGGAMRANVAVSRLKMRGGATLSDARVEVATAHDALMRLSVEGRSPGDRPFSLTLGPSSAEPQSRVRFRSDDAGFAVRALTGAENVVGGTASADGDWRAGPPNQARFAVQMRNFQVVRLPAMARLLSSAGSLTGLVEMLNGDGIGFSLMDAQMTYANDRLRFTEGRMTGPSLGLTGAGSYDLTADNLDIDGVVAPSPLLNLSVLGSVPVIGDLLVSRRGEGVFGMTYAINGRAGEPRVGVNPASALTPGILRRIFEPLPRREETPAPPPAGGAHMLAPPSEAEGALADAAPGMGEASLASDVPSPAPAQSQEGVQP
ncbi:MAG: DUF3971 domain-containing protein [Hyphomonadaceae bacterium]